jgi:hypothetical protein
MHERWMRACNCLRRSSTIKKEEERTVGRAGESGSEEKAFGVEEGVEPGRGRSTSRRRLGSSALCVLACS